MSLNKAGMAKQVAVFGATILSGCLWPSPASAQATTPAASSSVPGYSRPPRAILEVMRAPSPPVPFLNPTRDRLLLVAWEDYPSIGRVATPFLRLAGVRIEPRNHSKHDTPGGYGINPAARSYDLVRLADGAMVHVQLPGGGCPGAPVWSADGRRFAFENVAADSVELWVGDADTGTVRRIPNVRLNPMFGDELQWMPQQKTLLVKLVPGNLGRPPAEPVVPVGPSIQESLGGKGQSSTYETRDTLGSAHDEELFDHFGTAQLALVDVSTGSLTQLGHPERYTQVDPAPDGIHLLVATLKKPYSYVTTYERFPQEVEVWNLASTAKVVRHPIASLPLADRVPIHGEPLGPRDFSWRPTGPATLVWAEALDGGDWNVKVPHRDKVMFLSAPFTAAPAEAFRTEQRYSGLAWGEKPGFALLNEYDHNRHWRRSSIVNPDDPKQAPLVLWDLSTEEKYADPGYPVWRRLPTGSLVLRQDGEFGRSGGVNRGGAGRWRAFDAVAGRAAVA